ncbi:DUF805 domain-containing protein [Aurantiacibacter luteus]|uniref:DUF805 domain-containing protein n=1 Tax=Aurantiacibacter luteus TaxID=1581420 RepID=A0A0G9MY75_9SPHN|nr:DUF805 domain-containing protein [Aurantiacibacter luteus]KLE35549.1 hypothetical protein AAW00_03750 [Aurantiacibacter luteus]
MLTAIKYCLGNLANFAGRDARPTFWWYLLFLLIVQFVAGLLISIPLVVDSATTAYDAAQSGADQAQMQSQLMAQMGENLASTIWLSLAVSAVTTLMLLAAFVRRLHDGGFTGWIAAIPLATQAIAMVVAVRSVDVIREAFAQGSGTPANIEAMQAQVQQDPLNYVAWIGYLVVIVFGVWKSQPGANRYGAEPALLG